MLKPVATYMDGVKCGLSDIDTKGNGMICNNPLASPLNNPNL